MVERWSELTKARRLPSRVRLIEPLIREGVVTGCGSPRGRPEASSIATRQRFMEPPRTLAKKSVRPSGDQTGFQSTAGSLVTSTGTGSPVGVGGDRPEVALAAVVPEAPEGDAPAARGPARLDRVASLRELPHVAPGRRHDPQLREGVAAPGVLPVAAREHDLLAVGRPGRVVAEVGESLHGLAGRAHDEDAAAVPVGAEGDALAVRREGRGGVRGRAVRGEVDRVAAPDPLQVDVRVPGRVAHEHERRSGGTDLGLALLAGQVRELLERPRHRAGAPAAASDPPPDLDAATEQGQRGETERDGPRPPAPLRQRLDDAALRDRAAETVEVEGEVPRRLEALVGALLEAVLDDEVEGLRDARVRVRGRRRLVAQHRAEKLRRARPLEGTVAREHLEEHGAQREDVRPVVGHLAAGLLGRQVAHGADHGPRVRGPGGGRRAGQVPLAGEQGILPREAEVEDLDAPVVQEEEVLGLDVAVDDALVVRGGEALRHPRRVLGGLAHADRPLAQPRAHRLALEHLRHHEEPIALLAGVVDRDDVGVRERRHRLRLGLEAGERVGVIGEVLRAAP